MMTTNVKLVKEIRNIIASTTKAKTITQQEIAKVDAKYAALAEKEKADLNRLLKMQETQIAAYTQMLGDEAQEQETEKTEEAAEPQIQDTIFPDNNAEQPEDTAEAGEPAENSAGEKTDDLPPDEPEENEPEGDDDEWPEEETPEESTASSESTTDLDDWELPVEEWK